jgi:tetratricopeptide (TPR) repeat protein
MKKSFLIFFIASTLFSFNANAQNYQKFMQQGKNCYNQKEYLTALERFDFAWEFAKTDLEKNEAKAGKIKCKAKINEILQEYNKIIIVARDTKTREQVRDSLIERGNICFEIKDYECAAKIYAKALGIDNNNMKILIKLDTCYYETKDYKGSYTTNLKLMELDSMNYKHFFNYSYYALFYNDYEGSIQAAKKSLILKPEKFMVVSNLAIAYILNNQYPEAEKIYKEYRYKHEPGYVTHAQVSFYSDIHTLEKAGIHHEDFKKAKELLK